jgi:hypothetical protein
VDNEISHRHDGPGRGTRNARLVSTSSIHSTGGCTSACPNPLLGTAERFRSCGHSSLRFIGHIATRGCWKCEAIIATPDEATVARPRPKSVCRNPLLKSFSHDGVSRCGSSRNYPRSHDSPESGDFCFRRKGAGETVRSLGSSPRQMTFPLCPICVEPMKKQGRTFECEPCRQIIIFFMVSDASRYIILCRNLFTDALAPNVRPYPAGALIHQSEPHHTALERR